MAKWLRRLKRWLWKRRKPKRSHILKRWYTKDGAILQIERNTPGARATLRLIKPGNPDYILTLDFLTELRADFIGEFNGTIIALRSRKNPGTNPTHRFAVFMVSLSGSSKLIGAWDVDLESTGISLARGYLVPGRALLQLGFAWLRSAGTDFDWVGILEEKIRVEGNPRHRINPTKLDN